MSNRELPRYVQFGRRIWDRVNVCWYAEFYTSERSTQVCDALNQADRVHVALNGDTSYLRMVWRKIDPSTAFGPQNMMYS